MHLLDWFIKRKIPKDIENYSYKVMHITDTPDMTFGFLETIIRLVSPDMIVHTGDFVDNYKLELSRKDIDIYERRIQSLLRVLRSNNKKHIVMCLGNHDDEEIVMKYLEEDEVLCRNKTMKVKDIRLSMAHLYQACSKEADICLFGHSYDQVTEFGKRILLNGLDGVYVIDAHSKDIAMISYPKDTDDYRQRKFKIGL
ncbi:hypothetical protein EZV73_18690 [Acidaminobacter sp. JC074]|uniref:metallophosphoesterase n=1 Tax=Acidaminobacter sp. JC074 TaxID=2530199 RepID=UPI001F10074B|nr:metallophosphoesterase [Acidaminobacter sp. JC074]MCH4889617.1 hypothetical protein [Acidaminobacter sp. JC074]